MMPEAPPLSGVALAGLMTEYRKVQTSDPPHEPTVSGSDA
jgi:hypothetical protein